MKILLLIVATLFSAKFCDASETLPLHFNRACQKEKCFQTDAGLDLRKTISDIKLGTSVVYESVEFSAKDLSCVPQSNCYIFLGKVADSFSFSLNGYNLTNHITSSKNYLHHKSTILAIPSFLLNEFGNKIEIEVEDLNKYQWGLLNKNIIISNYKNASSLQEKDWLLRTGFTLFSAYSLLIFALLSFSIFLIMKKINLFYIFIYSSVSFLYLISFSEVPKEFWNPEILSGTVHFPLRLLQDLILFLTFDKILNKSNNFKFYFRSIIAFYIITISVFLGFALVQIFNFDIVKYIILIAAPLVAMPMSYGLALAFKQPQSAERSILLPLFTVLFIFQVHDLLQFWQIIDSYYTVKIYIPYIVILLLFVEIRRYSLDYTLKNLLAEKVQNAKQIAHDIRSPLSAPSLLASRVSFSKEESNIFIESIQRMQLITNDLIDQTNITARKKMNPADALFKIIKMKKFEYPDVQIFIENNFAGDAMVIGNATCFMRIISNLINNSVEASSTKDARIYISLNQKNKFLKLEILDNGKGIPKNILKKMGEFGFSYGKEQNNNTGSGLGLYNAFKTVEQWGGELRVTSKINFGTTIRILIPSTRT